eukprot:6463798-Amphidinium_carterae.1
MSRGTTVRGKFANSRCVAAWARRGNKLKEIVHVCARACVRACVGVCVCVCVRACVRARLMPLLLSVATVSLPVVICMSPETDDLRPIL